MGSLINLAVALRLRLAWFTWGRRLLNAANDPMRLQHALLGQLLRDNANSSFGREYTFNRISTYADFASMVPVQDYEGLRPYVDAQIDRNEPALTIEPPVRYVRTSGTTGRPKDIPLTERHLRRLRRIQQISVANQHRVCPEAFRGGILSITSPAFEGTLAGGQPYGSASGVVADSTSSVVQRKFVLPAQVLAVSDSRLKYLLILRLALARGDITYIGTANASTVLTLIKLYREHEELLIQDLRVGGFSLADQLNPEVLDAVRHLFVPAPGRAAELAALRRDRPTPRVSDLWPELRLVVSWTCASAGVAANALKAELGPRARLHELGYLSSEFRGTVTVGRRSGSGLPTFDTHFFEFVETDGWDRGEPEFLTLDRVRRGVDYYIIVTTPSGLYRYFINDIVRVSGFLRRTPMFKFVQKGKGVTNITGEKLYETQVLTAVNEVMATIDRVARFVIMLADEDLRGYLLYVEPDSGTKPGAEHLARAVDARLQELNVEYCSKRESARLGALQAFWLASGAEEAYRCERVRQGQRESQFKVVALEYRSKFGFNLDTYIEQA